MQAGSALDFEEKKLFANMLALRSLDFLSSFRKPFFALKSVGEEQQVVDPRRKFPLARSLARLPAP